MRKSTVGQRKFSDFICVGSRNDLFEKFFIFCGVIVHDDSIFKFKINSFNHFAIAIKGLIKADSSVSTSSIRRCKNLERGDITSFTTQPLSVLSDFYFEICIGSGHMYIFYGESGESIFYRLDLSKCFSPLSNGIV